MVGALGVASGSECQPNPAAGTAGQEHNSSRWELRDARLRTCIAQLLAGTQGADSDADALALQLASEPLWAAMARGTQVFGDVCEKHPFALVRRTTERALALVGRMEESKLGSIGRPPKPRLSPRPRGGVLRSPTNAPESSFFG